MAPAPSGALLLVDAGYLGLWCHDRPPADSRRRARRRRAGGARQRRGGPAHRGAGRVPRRRARLQPAVASRATSFDIQRQELPSLEASFRRHVLSSRWNAHLVLLPERVTHLHRVDLALAHGNGAGYVQLSGLGCVVVGDLPVDRELEVRGRRMEAGSEYRRQALALGSIECRPEVEVSDRGVARRGDGRSRAADRRRRRRALGAWVRTRRRSTARPTSPSLGTRERRRGRAKDRRAAPARGRARLARSAGRGGGRARPVDRSAGAHAGGRFPPCTAPLPLDGAGARRRDRVRARSASAAAQMCGFMTTWGDGMFPVVRELGAGGQLVRIRIELAPPDDAR